MNITQAIKDLKKDPAFADNVGMILIHNGVVRGWSRKDHKKVTAVEVSPDHKHIEKLCRKYSQKPGIFKIIVEAKGGNLKPGDDLLFIIVAGDIRENVKPVLSELLDKIKSEAIVKNEIKTE